MAEEKGMNAMVGHLPTIMMSGTFILPREIERTIGDYGIRIRVLRPETCISGIKTFTSGNSKLMCMVYMCLGMVGRRFEDRDITGEGCQNVPLVASTSVI